MKLYDYSGASNPRRVRIFIAEKNIDIENIQVDLAAKQQFSEEYRKINPYCVVPTLLLDDGTALGEVPVICRYLEEIYPDPPLIGRTAEERAIVGMWERRIELDGYFSVVDATRNSNSNLKGHALTGVDSYQQIPELAERGKKRTIRFFEDFDSRLQKQAYAAGAFFSMADITAVVALDLAKKRLDMEPDSKLKALHRWYSEVSSRPSMKA
ncbi:glutathione S-transferase domain protein [Zymomonas mobilis subsp. mobilis ZM4 = ATCC 31821]|uniref:Glutathione S-transferase domain protein n=2 Tax=Zymomonas mobilis subsp. mobilis TaxID=120045 RepID=Q5NP01_ZYMMO|nr:glutathione S-transferase [Zymomonas mobilis]AAV89559.1 Glutathione S-transferase domain protein [Zymomonas mobilis subsp. mobilis ZM4 = ATCC 31821]AEH62216.1 Glutathione S-transferase domain-containing protein [Zymomonas mobilis subsp. mobilis ATCC 10988]ART92870.1 glutathione S-transferase [Zymomonas mobilis subsp. mobilis]AVZ25853.1 glutathione S-transferase domain protein [Zymomonas mobilis subsp. mobilis]AVZ27744.1 glutathione S-transferase domain protein [Zymomonas mobilis subsp. mobi